MLGYWTDLSDLASSSAWIGAGLVLAVIYGSRLIMLRLMLGPAAAGPLMWIAPRGLITVLLFLHVREAFSLPAYLNGSIMLVVLVSSALILVASYQVNRQVSLSAPPDVPPLPPLDEELLLSKSSDNEIERA